MITYHAAKAPYCNVTQSMKLHSSIEHLSIN